MKSTLPLGLSSLLLTLILVEGMGCLFATLYYGHGVVRLGLVIGLLAMLMVLFRTAQKDHPVHVPWRLPQGPYFHMGVLIIFLVALTGGNRFHWGAGRTQFALLFLVGMGFLGLWLASRWAGTAMRGEVVARVLITIMILFVGMQTARELAWAVDAAHRTGHLRLDEGRTSWRAAELIWRGENPYGRGVIVDDTAFMSRLPKRQALGIGPTMPADKLALELDNYLSNLDPNLARTLLPDLSAAPLTTQWEGAMVGYKYGPALVLLIAALDPMVGAAAVPLSNGLACFALFCVLALILRAAGAHPLVTGLAVLMVMLDPMIVYFYVHHTATDIWPILFGFLAVLLAMHRRPGAAGIALAIGLACKLVPAVLFLLLLPLMRSWRGFGAWVIACAILLLPWLAWDPIGFASNYLLWGLAMAPDTNSWVHDAPAGLVILVRAVLVAGIAVLALQIARLRQRQLCVAFAAITLLVIAGGSAFHNNYLPWASVWVILAIVETLALHGAISARLLMASRQPAPARHIATTRPPPLTPP